MSDYLTNRFAAVYDRQQEHLATMDPTSIEDLWRATPLVMETTVTQWTASLDIKTRHELMKSSIEGIR